MSVSAWKASKEGSKHNRAATQSCQVREFASLVPRGLLLAIGEWKQLHTVQVLMRSPSGAFDTPL